MMTDSDYQALLSRILSGETPTEQEWETFDNAEVVGTSGSLVDAFAAVGLVCVNPKKETTTKGTPAIASMVDLPRRSDRVLRSSATGVLAFVSRGQSSRQIADSRRAIGTLTRVRSVNVPLRPARASRRRRSRVGASRRARAPGRESEDPDGDPSSAPRRCSECSTPAPEGAYSNWTTCSPKCRKKRERREAAETECRESLDRLNAAAAPTADEWKRFEVDVLRGAAGALNEYLEVCAAERAEWLVTRCEACGGKLDDDRVFVCGEAHRKAQGHLLAGYRELAKCLLRLRERKAKYEPTLDAARAAARWETLNSELSRLEFEARPGRERPTLVHVAAPAAIDAATLAADRDEVAA